MPSSETGGERTLALAKRIVDSNLYMTLATADSAGRPWPSPVWFAQEGYTEFLWVSKPDARHSRNLAGRPELGIVIFDSTVPVGGAQAVYVEALAEEVAGAERERYIAIYSRRSEAHGAGAWHAEDVTSPAPHRLFRATASRLFVLDADDRRIPVDVP